MMIPAPPRLTRRGVVTGLAALAALQPAGRTWASDEPTAIAIKQGPAGAIFDPPWPPSFRLGDRIWLNLTNTLAVPVALGTLGLDGAAALQPSLDPQLEAGKTTLIDRTPAAPGTFVFGARSVDDGPNQARAIAAFTVTEQSPPLVDQDQVLLIEDTRQQADGTSIAPSVGAGDARAVYTINGQPHFELRVRLNERLRLRLINGCQRNAIALQFDDHDLRVIAIDSRPAEPFLARDRRLVLAPGTRMDVLVDATQPAGSTSAVQLFDGTGPRRIGQLTYANAAPARAQILPAAAPLPDVPIKLELAAALRVQIDFGSSDWLLAKDLVAKRSPPLFRVKRGRTVLLTLSNRTTLPAMFHLNGHHFRWLDRLDDGWKPFLPDTMLVDVGQTERVAFRADVAGDWLIENTAMDRSAPQRVHWFAVE